MKLLFILESLTIEGGMTHSVMQLMTLLSKKENIEIACVCQPSSDYAKDNHKSGFKRLVTKHDWHIGYNYKWIRALKEVRGILKVHYDEQTYVITNDVGGCLMLLLSSFVNGKIIYINRGGNLSGYVGRVVRWMINSRRIFYTICTSSMQEQMIRTKCPNVRNTIVIHNGISLPSKEYTTPSFNSDVLKLSTVGYIASGKNQEVGVKLVKNLRDKGIKAELNIFGAAKSKGDIAYMEYLRSIITRNRVGDYVKFFGYQNQETIYRETDILVSFSLSEGFGRTLVEAIFRKKPIIAWRGAKGPIDITANGQFGFLTEENTAEAFEEKIAYILNHKNTMNEYLQNSYQFAVENFTESIMIENYYKFFNSLKP